MSTDLIMRDTKSPQIKCESELTKKGKSPTTNRPWEKEKYADAKCESFYATQKGITAKTSSGYLHTSSAHTRGPAYSAVVRDKYGGFPVV